MKNLYDEDYFERGIEAGVSCYENYHWMREATINMCKSIVNFSAISVTDRILDFGCAKGFLVKAFLELGYDCSGTDISEYAISNCDPEVKDRVRLLNDKIDGQFDVIITKDVLEHVPYEQIENVLHNFRSSCRKLVVIVPLAHDGKYVAKEYELDTTHVIRENMEWWIELFAKCGFEKVHSSYRVKGIKDNWSHYEKANGFFVCQ